MTQIKIAGAIFLHFVIGSTVLRVGRSDVFIISRRVRARDG